jgi:hypothetical protein
MQTTSTAALLAVMALGLLRAAPPPMPPETPVTRISYRGWPQALKLSNGVVEAIIVPAVGRVMQFQLAGGEPGPLWENPTVTGASPGADAQGWVNFGGDKVWPAPQTAWPKVTPRGWPPPAGFDGHPMAAASAGAGVDLTSEVDRDYGVRIRRHIELAPDRPVMTIITRFEKVTGPPVEIGVWTITQLRDPVIACAVLPEDGSPAACVPLAGGAPPQLKLMPGRIELTRDPTANRKIGVRAATLLWIGAGGTLRIDSPLVPGGDYPDGGSAAEIYTNADPLPYVELEMLGPLSQMKVGDTIAQVVTYTLARRAANDPSAEIARLLAASAAAPPRGTGNPR